jgi:hypothetical protein
VADDGQEQSRRRAEPVDQIGRRRALVKNGWLRELSEAEMKVLEYYEFCANPDGSNARPKLSTVVKEIGVSEAHVKDARSRLVQFRLLAREDDGRGGRDIATFTVLTPPRAVRGIGKQARKDMRDRRRGSSMEGGSNGGGVQRTPGPLDPGCKARPQQGLNARPQGVTNARAPYKDDQSHYQSHNQSPFPGVAGAAEAAGGGACADAALASAGPGRKRPRVLSDEQQKMRLDFGDWWLSAEWPRWNGGETYGFEGDRDGPAVLRLLRHPKVKWDLQRAQAIARFYLEQRDGFLVHSGHPLPTLAARVNYYASKLDQRTKEGGSHVLRATSSHGVGGADRRVVKPSPAERGEFDEPVGRLRVLNAPAAAAG